MSKGAVSKRWQPYRKLAEELTLDNHKLKVLLQDLYFFYLMIEHGGPDGSDHDEAIYQDAETAVRLIADQNLLNFPTAPNF